MPAKIIINPNGSIKVEGDFTIEDSTGTAFGLGGRAVIGLCRCGASDNKPFCDGSHRKIGFQSTCAARELPPPAPKI
jgi:CDGSH-type Zn-finger protein